MSKNKNKKIENNNNDTLINKKDVLPSADKKTDSIDKNVNIKKNLNKIITEKEDTTGQTKDNYDPAIKENSLDDLASQFLEGKTVITRRQRRLIKREDKRLEKAQKYAIENKGIDSDKILSSTELLKQKIKMELGDTKKNKSTHIGLSSENDNQKLLNQLEQLDFLTSNKDTLDFSEYREEMEVAITADTFIDKILKFLRLKKDLKDINYDALSEKGKDRYLKRKAREELRIIKKQEKLEKRLQKRLHKEERKRRPFFIYFRLAQRIFFILILVALVVSLLLYFVRYQHQEESLSLWSYEDNEATMHIISEAYQEPLLIDPLVTVDILSGNFGNPGESILPGDTVALKMNIVNSTELKLPLLIRFRAFILFEHDKPINDETEYFQLVLNMENSNDWTALNNPDKLSEEWVYYNDYLTYGDKLITFNNLFIKEQTPNYYQGKSWKLKIQVQSLEGSPNAILDFPAWGDIAPEIWIDSIFDLEIPMP